MADPVPVRCLPTHWIIGKQFVIICHGLRASLLGTEKEYGRSFCFGLCFMFFFLRLCFFVCVLQFQITRLSKLCGLLNWIVVLSTVIRHLIDLSLCEFFLCKNAPHTRMNHHEHALTEDTTKMYAEITASTIRDYVCKSLLEREDECKCMNRLIIPTHFHKSSSTWIKNK